MQSLPHADNHVISFPQRHEEHKQAVKAHWFYRKGERLGRDSQRQEKRREDGTRPFTGRNLYNHRQAIALHVRGATDITTPAPTAPTVEDGDQHHQQYHLEDEEEDEEAYYDTDSEEEVMFALEEEHQQATSGAMLLAMARPAKTPRRPRRSPPVMTDGETFEVVEIDGRLVALDEDGWEILPDENAEVSLLYSDIVRGTVL